MKQGKQISDLLDCGWLVDWIADTVNGQYHMQQVQKRFGLKHWSTYRFIPLTKWRVISCVMIEIEQALIKIGFRFSQPLHLH